MGSILTKADIQAYAPELDISAYSDTTLSGMLSMATRRAEQFASVDGFDFTTVTGEMDNARITNNGELVISVRRRPIYTVSAISLVKGGFSTSLNLNGTDNLPLYQIPTPRNKLIFPNSYFYLTGSYLAGGSSQLYTLRGANMEYTINYQGGYQTPPDDLKYAVLLYFRDAIAQRGAISSLTGAPISGFSQGSYSETYSAGARGKSGQSTYIQEAEDTLMNGGYCRLEF